ncbi:MAG: hypothetical protein M3O86_05480 [Actinomycetota bacterium]|nr:hypothetical protein [Actinomycetota bacterium]
MVRTKRRTNPVFDVGELRLVGGEPRAQRALDDPDSVDLLVWNVFSTLDTHRDRDWLAYRLEAFGDAPMRPPVRLSLWTGAEREPLLHPAPGYVSHVRERARAAGGDDASVAAFATPVEVPVRLESPDVLVLVDATVDTVPVGRGGRERIVELVDAGLEHARRLGKRLAVATVYQSGSAAATQLSGRINTLRDPAALAAALPHRRTVPPVTLREVSWQQLLRMWSAETGYLDVAGQPVKAFLEHCRARGLLR